MSLQRYTQRDQCCRGADCNTNTVVSAGDIGKRALKRWARFKEASSERVVKYMRVFASNTSIGQSKDFDSTPAKPSNHPRYPPIWSRSLLPPSYSAALDTDEPVMSLSRTWTGTLHYGQTNLQVLGTHSSAASWRRWSSFAIRLVQVIR